jgi:Tfp pilus assembly protein PilV
MDSRNRSQKGFSLVEVLIGLVFFGIGILSLGGLVLTAVRGNFFSNNLTQATYAAQERLEYLKNTAFTSDYVTLGDHHAEPVATVRGSDLVFNRSYTVSDNGDGSRTITYTVTWNDGVGHRITFSTIKSP